MARLAVMLRLSKHTYVPYWEKHFRSYTDILFSFKVVVLTYKVLIKWQGFSSCVR